MSVAERVERLRSEAGDATIVAVTKQQSIGAAREALEAGIGDLGENYVQEALPKLAALRSEHTFRAHFVGRVQTNKAVAIAGLFDVVQSVDRFTAASALSRAATRLGKRLIVLLQVNISPSERHGCRPDDAPALAAAIRSLGNLHLDGVMAIGPLSDSREEILRAFRLAAKTFDRVGGSTLSIGMSSDWREALRAGSTMLRVGTALFGPRSRGRG